MKKYDEYQNYLKQMTNSVDKNFRRLILIDCLGDYMDELLERKNILEPDSEEYRKLEKRRAEIIKLIEIVSEERRLAYIHKNLQKGVAE